MRKIVIPIAPVTKKNHQRIVRGRYGAPMVIPSAQYEAYQQAAAKAAGTPFARGGGNLLLWGRKVAEWANAEQQTAAETPAEEPKAQESGKRLILEHARMEFNYTSFTDLAMFLRVAVPESGKVTVEW